MLLALKKWLAEPVESVLLQVPRALAASVLSALVDCGIYFFLIKSLAAHPVPAAVVGYLAGGVLQYYLCSVWVFPNAPASAAMGFLAFTVLSLVGLGITCLTIGVLHDLCGIDASLAKGAALGLSFGWNFASRKALLFRGDAQRA